MVDIGLESVPQGDGCWPSPCPGVLPPRASCALDVTFAPSSAGAATGTLMIETDATPSRRTTALAGTGAVPAVGFDRSGLSYPLFHVGATSAAQAVRVANTGHAPLRISAISTSYDYVVTGGSCGSGPIGLALGDGCTLDVAFRRVGGGPRNGAPQLQTNVPGGPATLPLDGVGQLVPALLVDPDGLAFGDQTVGTTGSPLMLHLTNDGRLRLVHGQVRPPTVVGNESRGMS